MKKILLFGLISALCFSRPMYAQNVTQEEQALIRKEIIKMVNVEPTRIDTPALRKVFSSTFYNIKITREGPGGGTFGMSEMRLARAGDVFVEPENTVTNQSMPKLKSIIRKDFRLNTEEGAQILQEALDSIYSISSFEKAKTIKHSDNEWIFVRGKFFDKFKGFIFKVDKNGVITDVNYSLGIQ